MDFIQQNWQVILTTLGVTATLGMATKYLWERITRWIERNDLDYKKLQVEKIKELIELRKTLASQKEDEELLVHTILKTATTLEILTLAKQINKSNTGFKYYLKQFSWAIAGLFIIIFFAAMMTTNIQSGNIDFLNIIYISLEGIGGVIGGLATFSIIATERSKKKISSQYIASAIIQAKSRDQVDIIITRALNGESFVQQKKGIAGIVLGEMEIKPEFEIKKSEYRAS